MGTKSREVIWSGRIMATKTRAQEARQRAQEAAREADRAEVAGPHGRLWRPGATLPDHRPRDTPIWKLEASLKCRSCKKGRYAPPVRVIKLRDAGDHALQMGAS